MREDILFLNEDLQVAVPESAFTVMKRASFGPEHVIEGWLRGKRLGKLLYKATKHGFNGDVFHQRCDDAGATITLIQSSEGVSIISSHYLLITFSSPLYEGIYTQQVGCLEVMHRPRGNHPMITTPAATLSSLP